MARVLLALCLAVTACDSFPLFGPLFAKGESEETGSIRVVLPRHEPVDTVQVPVVQVDSTMRAF